ncbi:hypothetical protein Q9L58_005037 [Maublancomyces gigas]|uniref:Ketoreductase domain-containing protein n=1 Tax=Discina gigas TaxID=1032678 RepID=A0ABR3GJI9_9PEZI
MSTKPVIILTGASRGVGFAIAHYLLRAPTSARLLAVARSSAPLEKLKSEYPGQFEFVAGDLGNPATARAAVEKAVSVFGRIDSLIINHGVLDPVSKISDANVEEWRRSFDIGFFSAVDLVKESITELRKSKGRVIFVSSGAAVTGYQGWGAYGASKAAMNHLSITLAAEEPDITSIAIRPGVMDTQMQQEIREKHGQAMGDHHKRFTKLKEDEKLLRPEQPGHVIAKLALGGGNELSGQFLKYASSFILNNSETD